MQTVKFDFCFKKVETSRPTTILEIGVFSMMPLCAELALRIRNILSTSLPSIHELGRNKVPNFCLLGVLLHYDDPVAHLHDLFFIDPVWLSQLVSSVVVDRKPSKLTAVNGIVNKNDLISFLEEDDEKSVIAKKFLPQFLR